MHAFWLVLIYDLLEDKRIDDVVIKTFALCFFKMAESFEHNTAERRNLNDLNDILADWVNEDLEKSLVEDMDSYVIQPGERKKNTFLCWKRLDKTTWAATKRKTKWVVKLFQGKKPLLCFEIKELNKQKLSEIDLFEKNSFLNVKLCLNRVVSGKKHHNTTF